jgi:hypothetical protein
MVFKGEEDGDFERKGRKDYAEDAKGIPKNIRVQF